MDKSKLVELVTDNSKKPGLWAKVASVLAFVALMVGAYYDIREDVKDTREDVKDADEGLEQLEELGAQSEDNLAESVSMMQKVLEYMYDELVASRSELAAIRAEFDELRMTVTELEDSWLDAWIEYDSDPAAMVYEAVTPDDEPPVLPDELLGADGDLDFAEPEQVYQDFD